MILIFSILFNLFEAIYEALYDKGQKVWSALIENILKAGVVFICLAFLNGYNYLYYDLKPFYEVGIAFIFIRFAIFDITYNLTFGHPLTYYGTVKWYDRFMTKLGGWGWFVKGCCGIVGIGMLA